MIDFKKKFELQGEQSANYIAIVLHDNGNTNTVRNVYISYGVDENCQCSAWLKMQDVGNKCYVLENYTGEVKNFIYRVRIDNKEQQVELRAVSVKWRGK